MKFFDPHSLPTPIKNKITYRNLAVGERLFRRGDAAVNFFILATGRIRLIRPTINNQNATLQFAEPGGILGEDAIFESAYSSSAIATVASKVIVYPSSYLLSILQEYPDLVEDLLKMLLEKIKYFQTNMELREIRAANLRVLQYLNYAADNEHKIVNLNCPLQDIAAQIGFTPATFSRTLSQLEAEGSITRQSDVIILNDSNAA
ncbi:Crp/Fnr family transcriptional regulator [Pleurocapsa sp. PCC 7319]|uniref:Crp/Fnr family transcriptional regulator n=1 Tax=Pleurocapsa sp. PCC 7319 TaxID=118161 RepID=UPI000349B168|nr:Crp/Fnr family transcriptional regulator [Pleurocapsa sp. PCC 7319]